MCKIVNSAVINIFERPLPMQSNFEELDELCLRLLLVPVQEQRSNEILDIFLFELFNVWHEHELQEVDKDVPPLPENLEGPASLNLKILEYSVLHESLLFPTDQLFVMVPSFHKYGFFLFEILWVCQQHKVLVFKLLLVILFIEVLLFGDTEQLSLRKF